MADPAGFQRLVDKPPPLPAPEIVADPELVDMYTYLSKLFREITEGNVSKVKEKVVVANILERFMNKTLIP